MVERVAVLLDGEFVKKTLGRRLGQFPDLGDITAEVERIAVRRGTLAHQGWQLGYASVKAMLAGTKQSVVAQNIAPRIRQKGVDMRIGLDIASLALKRLVSTIVLVAGDSDFVPAMKLARREGLRVLLDPLGSSHVRPELKVHADLVI